MSDRTVRRLVGVYDADGTLRGELAYFIGVRSGRAHCSLCDITHGMLRERSDWRACRSTLPVAFDTYHRNDQPDELRDVLTARYPAVAAETDRGWQRLLGPEELEACAPSPDELLFAIRAAVDREGLHWPGGERRFDGGGTRI